MPPTSHETTGFRSEAALGAAVHLAAADGRSVPEAGVIWRLPDWTRSRRPYQRRRGFRRERQAVTSGLACPGRPRVMPTLLTRLGRSAGDPGRPRHNARIGISRLLHIRFAPSGWVRSFAGCLARTSRAASSSSSDASPTSARVAQTYSRRAGRTASRALAAVARAPVSSPSGGCGSAGPAGIDVVDRRGR
jgi:hypothetical protein